MAWILRFQAIHFYYQKKLDVNTTEYHSVSQTTHTLKSMSEHKVEIQMRKFCGIKVFFDRFFPPNDKRRFTTICRREKTDECSNASQWQQSHHVQKIGNNGGENVVEREIIDQEECRHVPDE